MDTKSVYSPKVPILRDRRGRCKLCKSSFASIIEINDVDVCLGCFQSGDVAERCYYRADCIPLRCIPCSERGLL